MNWLAENSLPIWLGGAILLTLALVIYSQVRTFGALVGICVVVALTGLLLIAERMIETPREAVERTLYELADRVEANDVAGALSYISPSANRMRSDVETLMPKVRIEQANIVGTPRIDVDLSATPREATVIARGFVHATVKQSGMKGGDMAELTIQFVEQGDRWQVSDYSSSRDWRREIGH